MGGKRFGVTTVKNRRTYEISRLNASKAKLQRLIELAQKAGGELETLRGLLVEAHKSIKILRDRYHDAGNAEGICELGDLLIRIRRGLPDGILDA